MPTGYYTGEAKTAVERLSLPLLRRLAYCPAASFMRSLHFALLEIWSGEYQQWE